MVSSAKDYYFVGGDNQLTVIDTEFAAVIARLNFEGSVKGICMSSDEKSLVVQADNKIYQWEVGIDDLNAIDELRNNKKLFKSPSVDNKLYTGSTDKSFKEVVLNSDETVNVGRSFKCPEQVVKIAVNDNDTVAYLCCGAQNLYKFNLVDFKIEGDMVENLTGVCHNLLIQRIDKEYLFLCGKNNLFSKYDVETAQKVNELKMLKGVNEFIGLAYI